MEVIVIVLAVVWLIRFAIEELGAAIAKRPESPSVARRERRERLARECGAIAIVEAAAARAVKRIENPPDRPMFAKLRDLIAERWDDALTESRVRHQHAHEARLRAQRERQEARQRRPRRPQGRGWQARTGGSRPAAPPRPVVVDYRPCRGCDAAMVAAPAEWCMTCEAQPLYQWPPDPDPAPEPPAPEPDPAPETPASSDERTPTMPAATFTINGDVRDPRTALNAAEMMRGANNAIADEMDILLNNMRLADLGQGMLDAIASLADEQRSYADSNAEQCRVYGAQVLAQQDIYDDEDLRSTVRDTYLDMEGGDLVTPPAAVPGSVAISATDCNTPEAGAWFCDQVARAYDGMKVSIDQMKGNHEQQNAPAESIDFLGHQLGYATQIATHATALRDRFQAHVAKLADTLDPNDLRGTQHGKYARTGA